MPAGGELASWLPRKRPTPTSRSVWRGSGRRSVARRRARINDLQLPDDDDADARSVCRARRSSEALTSVRCGHRRSRCRARSTRSVEDDARAACIAHRSEGSLRAPTHRRRRPRDGTPGRNNSRPDPASPARALGARDARDDLAFRAVLVVRDEADSEHGDAGPDVEGADPSFGAREVQRERRDNQ